MNIIHTRHSFLAVLCLASVAAQAGLPWNPFKKKTKTDSTKIVAQINKEQSYTDTLFFKNYINERIEQNLLPWRTDLRMELPDSMEFCGEMIDMRRADLRERLDREFLAFQYGHTNSMLTIKRANRIFPIVEPILAENNIPDDFKYLMCIESSCDIFARSKVGACGLWQLMEPTAVEHGLEVNDMVDERYNIEKATKAACDYFHKAYEKYHDWISVAASYNAGMSRISQQLDRQQAKTALDLHLNEETSRYMFRILVMKKFFEDPKAFGFNIRSCDLYPPMEYTVEYITGMDNWADFALGQGINYSDLRLANPWIRNIYLKQASKVTAKKSKSRKSRSKKNKKSRRRSRSHKKMEDVSAVQSSTDESVANITAKTDTVAADSTLKKYKVLIPTKESLFYNPKNTKAHRSNWVTD